jgi:hypothetical protein
VESTQTDHISDILKKLNVNEMVKIGTIKNALDDKIATVAFY